MLKETMKDSPSDIAAFLDYFDAGGEVIEFATTGDAAIARPGGGVERATKQLHACRTREERRKVLCEFPGLAGLYTSIFRSFEEAQIEGMVKTERPE